MALVQEVVDEDDRPVEGLDGLDLVVDGRIMLTLCNGKALDGAVEILVDMEALSDRIGHEDIAQGLAEGDRHVRPAALLLIFDDGDAVDFSHLLDDLVVKGTHVERQDKLARINVVHDRQ